MSDSLAPVAYDARPVVVGARYGIPLHGRLALLQVVWTDGERAALGDVERGPKARLVELQVEDLLARGDRLDEAGNTEAANHVADALDGRN